MILRALFWIAVVAILLPHEPNLGLGTPQSASAKLFSGISQAMASDQAGCRDKETACIAASGILARIQGVTAGGLADVKAQLAEARRERGGKLF